MDTRTLETQLRDIVEPICSAHGVDLVDVRYAREPGGAVLRVLIDRPSSADTGPTGVSLEDCTGVSRDLSTALDVHDIMPGHYRLEVSSPGVERPLVRPADFQNFAGKEIKVATIRPIPLPGGEPRRKFQGTLRGFRSSEGAALSEQARGVVELDQDGARVEIPFDAITKAHLVFRWGKPSRP